MKLPQNTVMKNSRLLTFTPLLTLLHFLPLASPAYAETSTACPGETGYIYTNDRNRNPREGGFVSDSAHVEDSVFIAKTAAICGSASILDKARIYGNAVISDEAEISGYARVFGNARVSGTAQVGDKAKVSGYAIVKGNAIIDGKAWIRGYKKINSGQFSEGTFSTDKPKSLVKKVRKQKKELMWLRFALIDGSWRGNVGTRNKRLVDTCQYKSNWKKTTGNNKNGCKIKLYGSVTRKCYDSRETREFHARRYDRSKDKIWFSDNGFGTTINIKKTGPKMFRTLTELRLSDSAAPLIDYDHYLMLNNEIDVYSGLGPIFYFGSVDKRNEFLNRYNAYAKKYCSE